MPVPFPVIPVMHHNLNLSGEQSSLVLGIDVGVMLLVEQTVLIIPVLRRIACLRRKSHAETSYKEYRCDNKTRNLFK